MTKELCEVCTGSYTGEFSPKWRGPWAQYFSADGTFLEAGSHHNAESQERMKARTERFDALLEQNRLPLGAVLVTRW